MAIIKLRRPRSQWANPDQPEFYATFYMKFRWRGKQYLRNTRETKANKAAAIERAMISQLNGERWEAALTLFEGSKLKRTGATIGQVAEAYLAPGVRILKSDEQARRNVNDLYNVVAYSKGVWAINEGGRVGFKIGGRMADRGKIDKLPVSILDKDLVRAYYAARSEDGEINWNEPAEENRNINSMLKHARCVFGKGARELKLDKLQLPDLKGFRTCKLLPVDSPDPQPLTPAEFAAMVASADEHRAADPELWLVNVLLRRTGLRSSYLLAARGHWLEEHNGRLFVSIRNRPDFRKKPGTRDQLIPLDDELAGLLRARGEGFLVLPAGTDGERKDLVRRRHNAWLKGMIGGLGETTQGNHRLRDTVASALWTLYGSTAAQEALGHMSADMTAKHYAKRLPLVCEVMRRELAAWAPAAQAKVVPMIA